MIVQEPEVPREAVVATSAGVTARDVRLRSGIRLTYAERGPRAGPVVIMPAGEALAIGILMNTRGLMELIILNVGLEIGVIGPALFAMMVMMALVTTAMTSPLITLVVRRAVADAADGDARRAV